MEPRPASWLSRGRRERTAIGRRRLSTGGIRKMLRFSWSLVAVTAFVGPGNAHSDEPVEPDFEATTCCSDCDPTCSIDCGPLCGEAACSPLCELGGCADCACDPCDCGSIACCEVCCPQPWEHRTGAFGEWLYLHPVGADLHHAQQQSGTGGAGTTPFGTIASADPQFSSGVRTGVSVACGMCSSLAASYTFLETDSRSYVDVPGPTLQTGSLVQHPGAGIISSAGPLNATYDIDFQLADLMYRRLVVASQRGWLNYSAGLGYARIDQEFLQTGTFSGSQNGVINTSTEVDFDGYGIRFGLDGERQMGRGRLSGYCKGNVSALFGEFRGDYLMQNVSTVENLAIARWTDDRVVPTLDYEIGIAWTSCCGRTRVSLGYTGMHFMNVATTPTFIDAVQANNYSDFGDTLSLEGAVSRIEYRF